VLICDAVNGCIHMCLFIAGANNNGRSMSHARTTHVYVTTTAMNAYQLPVLLNVTFSFHLSSPHLFSTGFGFLNGFRSVLVYRCLHDSAPGYQYLASDLQHVSDLGAHRRLRSSSMSALVAPRTVHATIGDRAFPAAAASIWNSLPETVHASPSLPVFRRR